MTARTRAWILVAVLWVVFTLNYLDRQVIFSIFPPLKKDLNLTDYELGLIGAVFLWVYGFLSPFAGYLGDRFSRSKIIVFSLVVWSLVTWLTGYVRSFGELILARGLMGISEAAYLPAAVALLADHHDNKTRSRAIGMHQSGIYVGILLGGVGGGWIADRYGWRSVFTFLGLAGVVYAVFAARFVLRTGQYHTPQRLTERLSMWSALKELLGIRNFVILCSINAVTSIGWWMVFNWLPTHLYERFKLTLTDAGFTATFYLQVVGIFGILVGGVIADRWSLVSPRGRLLVQVIGLLSAAPFLFVIGQTHSYPILIASLILCGAGRGFFDCNTVPVMCQFVRPELRSTAWGMYTCMSCLCAGAFVALAGKFKETLGLGGAFQIAAGLVFLCGLSLLTVRFGSGPEDSGALSRAKLP